MRLSWVEVAVCAHVFLGFIDNSACVLLWEILKIESYASKKNLFEFLAPKILMFLCPQSIFTVRVDKSLSAAHLHGSRR